MRAIQFKAWGRDREGEFTADQLIEMIDFTRGDNLPSYRTASLMRDTEVDGAYIIIGGASSSTEVTSHQLSSPMTELMENSNTLFYIMEQTAMEESVDINLEEGISPLEEKVEAWIDG